MPRRKLYGTPRGLDYRNRTLYRPYTRATRWHNSDRCSQVYLTPLSSPPENHLPPSLVHQVVPAPPQHSPTSLLATCSSADAQPTSTPEKLYFLGCGISPKPLLTLPTTAPTTTTRTCIPASTVTSTLGVYIEGSSGVNLSRDSVVIIREREVHTRGRVDTSKPDS